MKNISIVLGEIDPNIYLNRLNNDKDFKCYVYILPIPNKVMIDIFDNFMKNNSNIEYKWITEEEMSDIIIFDHRSNNYDAVISFTEHHVSMTNEISKKLGLLHNDDIKRIQNKYYQRSKVMTSNPELSVNSIYLESMQEVENMSKINFPVIMKPIYGSGSKGVMEFKDSTQLKDFLKVNESYYPCVIEEKLIGKKKFYNYGDYISVESIVVNGNITHLCVCDKTDLVSHFRETGLIIPTVQSELVSEAYSAAEIIIKSLGYKYGPTHIELKITDDGLKLIEFNARAGGPIPIMIQMSSNYNIIKNIILSYLGIDVEKKVHFKGYGACFYLQLDVEKKAMLEQVKKYQKMTIEVSTN